MWINDFSKEELSCIAEVQKAPEWEQEWVFKKACKKLTLEAKSKLEILLFAWALLATPVMANDTANCQSFNSVEQSLSCNPKYKEYKKLQKTNPAEAQKILQESILNIYNNDFLVGIDPDDVGDFKDEFLWLPIELRQLYLDFYLEWKKYLKSPKDLDDFKRKISTLIVLMRDKRSWAEKHINILFKKVWYLQNTPFWNKLIFLAKEIDKIWELESAKKDQIIQEERKKQQQYEEATKRRQELAKKFKNL